MRLHFAWSIVYNTLGFPRFFPDEAARARIWWKHQAHEARCCPVKQNPVRAKTPKAAKTLRPSVPALEWVSEVSGRAVRVTAVGSRRVLVENHTGIRDFSGEAVALSTASGALVVRGVGLTLCEVRPNALIVRGAIRAIELPQEDAVQ